MDLIKVKRQLHLLLQARAGRICTVDDVIDTKHEIESILPTQLGIRWFNILYRTVTEEVRLSLQTSIWLQPKWLETLDVEFAKLYFHALRYWAANQAAFVSRSWLVPLSRSTDYSIEQLRFALAGMNAHINYDLAYAVYLAARQYGLTVEDGSLIHRDFCRIDEVLDEVEMRAMKAVSSQRVLSISAMVEPWDKRVMMGAVRMSRARAWQNAKWFMRLQGTPFVDVFDAWLDRRTALIGTLLLR